MKNIEDSRCFWHVHNCRYGRVKPATNKNFWQEKRFGNKKRDQNNIRKLRNQGWKVLVIWECQIRDIKKVEKKIGKFLENKNCQRR